MEHWLQLSTRRLPLIFGHRGSPREAPENTIESYRRAFDGGADGIELDVRVTRDGVLVCHHDRTVGARQKISRMTFADLYRHYMKRDEPVHTLEQSLRQVAGRGVINIELKVMGIEADVVAMARNYLPEGSFIFTSFHFPAVARCRKHAPDVPAFLILHTLPELAKLLTRLQEINASGIALRHRLIDEKVIAFFRSHKLPVFAWTVNRLPNAQWLADLGVSGLITDSPRELVVAFKARAALLAAEPVPAGA